MYANTTFTAIPNTPTNTSTPAIINNSIIPITTANTVCCRQKPEKYTSSGHQL